MYVHTRMHTYIHTYIHTCIHVFYSVSTISKFIPHPGTRGRGGGEMEPLPRVFDQLHSCSISKRFYLQWKAFDFLNKVRYILWLVTLLEACDQQWLELEIRLKPQEMVILCALHEKITHK